eukprot:435115_1
MMNPTVIRYFHEQCGGVHDKCADDCECLNDHCENDYRTRPMCPPGPPVPPLSRQKSGKNVLTMAKNQERKQETSGSTSKTAQATGKATTGKATTGKVSTGTITKAYEQIYGDDYVQHRGVGGYIPMYDAPYHYEHVQPVYQPQLASTNPDSMQYGLMLLGLGLFLCLAICIVFVLLSAVCFVVGRFSNAKKSDKIEYEELAV